MELEKKYNHMTNSSGVAKAGLATGIVGSALGAMSILGGGLGSMFNNNGACCNSGMVDQTGCCNEDHYVNRYEAQQMHQINKLETEVAFKDAEIKENAKTLELYKYVDGRFNNIEKELAAQAVRNQANADSFAVVNERMGYLKTDLEGQIDRERERRCCADDAIVNYSNCTFTPLNIIGCTTDPAVINPKPIYNPLPGQNCGGCGNYHYHKCNN